MKVKKDYVRDARFTLAEAERMLCLKELDQWHDKFVQGEKPLAVYHLRKFDEAKKRVRNPITLPVIGPLRSSITEETIDVFQSKRALMIVFVVGCIYLPIH